MPGNSETLWCKIWGQHHEGFSVETVRGQLARMNRGDKFIVRKIAESAYPIYDKPLVMTGDALILPDMEIPFHHAEFINRCLELADRWGVKQAILAGDVLHFDSLSGWEPAWTNTKTGGLTASAEAELMEFAKTLSPKKQGELMTKLGDIGQRTEEDGASTELDIASRELKKLATQFEHIDFVIGNHEGRLLRALNTALDPKILLKNLELSGDPKWRIAPFYFSYLDTAQGRYQIEHPKNAGKFSASKLVSKYLTHVIMCHSHQLNYTFDPSGQYYAIEMGCTVDETRLPYVAQRHNTSPMHALGAVIVRDGIPWLLHAKTDWARL